MITKRKAVVAGLLVLVLLAAWFIVRPAVKFASVRKRYPIGMTFEEAQLRLPQPFQISTGGVVFPSPGPTEEQKDGPYFTTIVSKKEGVYLDFNYHGHLVRVFPLDSPYDLFIYKMSRR